MKTKHHHFDSLTSTQDWAKENLPSLNLDEFHVISASEQTKGRGRFNRHWHSPKNKNAYVTYCFSIPLSKKSLNPISLVMGLTISEALQKLGLISKLKWPNDIFIDGKKAGGILIETQEQKDKKIFYAAYGLNINMDAKELQAIDCPATSLLFETKKTWSIASITEPIETLFKRNLAIFLEKGFEPFEQDFEATSFLAGKIVSLDLGKEVIKGNYVKVNNEGALVLQLKDGSQKAFFSGEIINWE